MAELISYSGKPEGKMHKQKKMPVNVDLTAMVDLAFLLITFFMLTTTLSKPRVMPVVMPNGSPGAVSDKSTMTIVLGKDNKAIWYIGMGDKPLTTPKVIAYGKEMRAAILETGKQVFASTGKSLMVLVKPAEHSVYSNLVEALDDLSILKVPSYAITHILTNDIDLLKQKGIY
jgi:biopolymer transport protein ExbD